VTDAPAPARVPKIGVGVVLFRGREVLLIRRGTPPMLGQWSIPGGRQEWGETLEATARRELFEETGVEAGPLVLVDAIDAIHRDEAGAVTWHYSLIDYAGLWTGGEARAGDDCAAVDWVGLDATGGRLEWSKTEAVIRAAARLLGID